MPWKHVVPRRREFTGKIRSKNGVRSTMKSRPTVGVVRNMNMVERKRGDPDDQPRCDQQPASQK
jgi:hypothetical protein